MNLPNKLTVSRFALTALFLWVPKFYRIPRSQKKAHVLIYLDGSGWLRTGAS